MTTSGKKMTDKLDNDVCVCVCVLQLVPFASQLLLFRASYNDNNSDGAKIMINIVQMNDNSDKFDGGNANNNY